MITSSSSTNTLYGNAGSVRIRIDVDVVSGLVGGRSPDITGLLLALASAAEEFMAKDGGVK